MEDVNTLTDEQIGEYQTALTVELNRRLRVAAIPQQIKTIVADARRGGELSDAKIREAFEAAMSEDVPADAA